MPAKLLFQDANVILVMYNSIVAPDSCLVAPDKV